MSIRVTTPAPGGSPAALDATATAARLSTTDETAVGDIIRQVTDLAERLAKLRFLWFRTYEAVLEGDDGDRLYLRAGRPLATVTEVKMGVDGDPLLEGTEAVDFEIWHDDGYLYREACWSSGLPPWRVAYTGGWWLPSMGDDAAATAAGAKQLTNDGARVERAIWRAVQLSWQNDNRDAGIRREKNRTQELEFVDGMAVPKESLDVFRSIGPKVV